MVQPADRSQPEDPQRHQRCVDARLDDQEGDERSARHGEKRDGPSRSPTDVRRLRERVDEQEQAAGHRDAPRTSNLRRTASTRLSGTIRGASSNTAMPIGRLRKKMYSQPT